MDPSYKKRYFEKLYGKNNIFEKFLETDRPAELESADEATYQEYLKCFRDLNNIIETAYEEGKAKAKKEAYLEAKAKGYKSEMDEMTKSLKE